MAKKGILGIDIKKDADAIILGVVGMLALIAIPQTAQIVDPIIEKIRGMFGGAQ